MPIAAAVTTPTALLEAAEVAVVTEKGMVTTTKVTNLAIEDGKGAQPQEMWLNVTQMTGTLLAAAAVAAAGGKKAYDLYRDFNKKE